MFFDESCVWRKTWGILRKRGKVWYNGVVAVVAQLVEQLIRNEQVAGSSPVNGSIFCFLIEVRDGLFYWV